ncbi:aminopeptidase N-like [Linepithema humile]|uniref:aminopeptidase N-like n=1 Tax=Linepithema humile TaxID=83485 RepID=UPI0006233BCB|nr:PREDICTED: endoplasmic reticulum aminopeptidase 2-like isoform X2 [Linepithema humile]
MAKFLLKCGLFIAMIILSTGKDGQLGINISENYLLPDYITPMHYKLMIRFVEKDLNVVSFIGDFNASIHINRTTQYIGLHWLKYKIHVTTMQLIHTYKENNITKEYKYNCSSFIYNYHTNIYVLYLQDKVSQGYYTLNIKYETTVSDNEGFFTTSYINKQGEKEWLLATHFQPIEARRIFPCWDEPHFTTTFEILLLHHSKYTILSNNFLSQIQYNATNEKLRWTYFNSPLKLPTHLMAFAMINFPRHFSNNIISMYCRDDVKNDVTFAWNVITKITDYFILQRKLLIKVNYVLIPNFPDDGLSNWELIFYRETAVVCDEKLDSIAHKIKVADLIARLTLKQWFNNTIIPSSWSHAWFTDSLATVFAMDAINETKIFEDNQIKYLFIEQIQYESFHLDDLHYNNYYEDSISFNVLSYESKSPFDIKSHFSLPYYRGVCILRMLQHIISDMAFRNGIDLRTYGNIPITPDHFWNILTLVIRLKYNKFDLDIKDIMNGWVRLWHYPVLTVKRNDKRNGVLVSIAKPISFIFSQSGLPNFWIPITYTTKRELNFTKTSFQDIIWLKNEPVEIYMIDTDWIIINLQQTGYYRVNYDYDIWRDIINYLHSHVYTDIHILNRAKLIDDAFHFMITQQLNSSIFWNLTHYLHQETSYIAWYPMFKAMEYMSKIFPYSDLEIDAIKDRLVLILDSLLLNITNKKDPKKDDLTQCLWREALKWTCILNNLMCEEHIQNLQEHNFLNNYIYGDPWMHYCAKLKIDTSNNLLVTLLQDYKIHSIREALESLVCSDNSALVILFLVRIRQNGGDIQLDRQTHIKMFFSIFASHAKRHEILDLLFYNFEVVKPSEINKVALLIHIINNVYSQESFNKIEKFVAENTTQLRFDVEQKIKNRLRNIEKHKNYVQTIRLFHEV